MTNRESIVPEIYVQPGESYLVKEATVLRTLLGSCIGITFLSPRLSVGALCHPMLPAYRSQLPVDQSLADGNRYVDFAIRNLARQFYTLGARRDEVEVMLFGGGDVLLVNNDASRPTVGKLNSETALRILEQERFHIVAFHRGGNTGMTIRFYTGTGEIRLRRLEPCAKQDP
jgi:chemotaxis protein CheD